MRGDEVVSVRGDDDDVFSHGFLCPKSQGLKQLHEDPDRLTAPARAPRRRAASRRAGRRRSPRSTEGLAERPRRGRPRRGRRLPRQPERPQPRRRCSTAPAFLKALGTKNIYSASTVDQMPKQVSAGLMFGGGAQRPGPRRRPHRPPADPRRQPAGLQRLAADRARHARPDPRDPRARRQGRRHRPAPQPHRQRGLRAPLHPPRHRRPPAVRDRQRADRRGPRRPGRARRARERRRAARRRSPSRSPPRPSRPVCGIDADEIRRMARELAAAERAAVYAPDRDHDAALRHAGELARRRPQLPDRQPRPRGRGDVPARRRRPAQLGRAAARPARACGSAAGRAGSAAGPRCSASCRSSASPRRSPPRARARCARWSRSPATRSSRPPTPAALEAAVETLDFMVSRRHLRQRDHPPRRRHPPRPRAAGQGPLRLRALPARRPQRRQLLAARDRAARGPARRVGDRAAARRDRRRPGTRRRHRGLGRPRRPDADRPRGRRCPARRSRAATPAEIAAALGERRGPERVLDFMLRVGPFGEGFGADPDGLTLAKLEAEPARDRPRARCARGCPTCCARRRARSSWRRRRSSPTSRGSRPSSARRRRTATWS